MTICWGKRRAVPPTTDHDNIQGKCCPHTSVLHILRNEAITQTPIRRLFTSSKEEKELLWGFYLVPLIQSFENQFQTCIQHVRPSGVGSFAYQQVGLWILWLQRSHPVWVRYDVVSEDSVYQTVRAHKKDVNIQPTRHLKQIRDGEWFTVSDLHKEALGVISVFWLKLSE